MELALHINMNREDLALTAGYSTFIACFGGFAAHILKMSYPTGAMIGALEGLLAINVSCEIVDSEQHPVLQRILDVSLPIFASAGFGYKIAQAMGGESLTLLSALALSGTTAALFGSVFVAANIENLTKDSLPRNGSII